MNITQKEIVTLVFVLYTFATRSIFVLFVCVSVKLSYLHCGPCSLVLSFPMLFLVIRLVMYVDVECHVELCFLLDTVVVQRYD